MLARLIVLFGLLYGLPVAALTDTPPVRTDNNLIVGFYNIKWIGQTPHDFRKLARVIQNFDICAVLEIKDEQALSRLREELVRQTGHKWNFTFGVRTFEPALRPYHETYGVLWREDRVTQGYGLVSNVWDRGDRFRNDPYIASFKADDFDFMIIMVHTRWTDSDFGTRVGEIAALADQVDFLRGFLSEDDLYVGGDFNYSASSKYMTPLVEKAGLKALDANDRTTFKKDYSDYANSYDHIYATPDGAKKVIGRPQALDVTRYIYGSGSLENMKKSKAELSDHLPIFMVLDRK